jgi:hypothetical protein
MQVCNSAADVCIKWQDGFAGCFLFLKCVSQKAMCKRPVASLVACLSAAQVRCHAAGGGALEQAELELLSEHG